MPNLVRIYDLESPAEGAAEQLRPKPSRRERRLFVAFSVLLSVNLLVLSGIVTFTALVVRR